MSTINKNLFAVAGKNIDGHRHMTHGIIVAGRCYRFEGAAPRNSDWTVPTDAQIAEAFIDFIAPATEEKEKNKVTTSYKAGV